MTGREMYRKPRYRKTLWGAYAERCARRNGENFHIYLRAVRALARAAQRGAS